MSVITSPLIAVGMILWLAGSLLGALIWLLLELLQEAHYFAVFAVVATVTIFVFATGDPLAGIFRWDVLIAAWVLGFGYFASGMYHELMD